MILPPTTENNDRRGRSGAPFFSGGSASADMNGALDVNRTARELGAAENIRFLPEEDGI